MSFSKLLEQLLAAVINQIGPALITLIIKWLQGLGDDDVKEVAQSVSDQISKTLKA